MKLLKKIFPLCFFLSWFLITSVQAATPIIVITEHGLIPATLKVAAGEKVQLVISNKADGLHRITVPGLNLQSPYLGEGNMTTLTFRANQAGTYTYYAPPSAWKGKMIIE